MMQKQGFASLPRSAFAFGALSLLLAGPAVRLSAQQAGRVAPSPPLSPIYRSISLTLHQKPLTEAIEALMQSAHVSYVFSNNLPNPTITASFKHVPAYLALESLLKASELRLSYRASGDIYYIFPTEKPQEQTTAAAAISPIGNGVPAPTPATVSVQSMNPLVLSLDFTRTNLFEALTMVMKQADENYTIDDSLKNVVITAHTRLPLGETLEALGKASGNTFTYTLSRGVYSFIPKAQKDK